MPKTRPTLYFRLPASSQLAASEKLKNPSTQLRD
jgi:hypothetical protein